MAYTTIDNPGLYFNTKIYTGTGSSNALTGIGFQPDWVWNKSRSATGDQALTDSVRGVTKEINSSDGSAEETVAQGLTEFGSDGFTVGSDGSYNANSTTYAAWCWKAGTTASGSTSGSGTAKTFSRSTSTTSGFSIVKYVGNATANHQFPHGLGVKPDMVWIKNLTDGTTNWQGYNSDLTATKSFKLNSTDAPATTNSVTNDVEPTATVFNLGSAGDANGNNQNHIAYLFASIQGYSKIGTYTGNGNADGAFVYTGFKPAWLLTKRTDSSSSGNWNISDNKRDPSNVITQILFADDTQSEITASNVYDYCSNGFKVRETGAGTNASGSVYMYMAFADSPFVNSNKVPTNAR